MASRRHAAMFPLRLEREASLPMHSTPAASRSLNSKPRALGAHSACGRESRHCPSMLIDASTRFAGLMADAKII